MAKKRKKFYAVLEGHAPGIYTSWEDCQRQLEGYAHNRFKGFETVKEAEHFMRGVIDGNARLKKRRKFYAVRVGKQCGIYETWEECQFQIRGFPRSQYKSFISRTQAEDYLSGVPKLAIYKSDLPQIPAWSWLDSQIRFRAPNYQVELVLSTSKEAKLTEEEGIYRLEYDGASKGNPGKAGAGAVLRCPDGSLKCELAQGLEVTTTNIAAYRALILGLRTAIQYGVKRLKVQGDSILVQQQIYGCWAVKNEQIAILYDEAKSLITKFEEVSICHVQKESNCPADALAKMAAELPEISGICSFPPDSEVKNVGGFGATCPLL